VDGEPPGAVQLGFLNGEQGRSQGSFGAKNRLLKDRQSVHYYMAQKTIGFSKSMSRRRQFSLGASTEQERDPKRSSKRCASGRPVVDWRRSTGPMCCQRSSAAMTSVATRKTTWRLAASAQRRGLRRRVNLTTSSACQRVQERARALFLVGWALLATVSGLVDM